MISCVGKINKTNSKVSVKLCTIPKLLFLNPIAYRPAFFQGLDFEDFLPFLWVFSYITHDAHPYKSLLYVRLVAHCGQVDLESKAFAKIIFVSKDGQDVLELPKLSITRSDEPTLSLEIFDFPPVILPEGEWFTTHPDYPGMLVLDRHKVLSLKKGSNDEDLLFYFCIVFYGFEKVLAERAENE